MATASGICLTAKNPRASPWITYPRDASSRSVRDLRACHTATTSQGCTNTAISWGTWKQLGLAYGSLAAWRIGRCWQFPQCPTPRYPTPWWPTPWCPTPQCPTPQCPTPQCPSPQCPTPRCLSPWCPTPRCPSPWGTRRWLGRQGVNQSSCCRGGDGCWVRVRVGFLTCSFSEL